MKSLRELRLLKQREITIPTWRGWLLIACIIIPLFVGGCRGLHPFLAVTDSRPGEIFVVEGWASDSVLELALQEVQTNHYAMVCITGGPIDVGAPLYEYKTYAERGAAILQGMGISTNLLHAVPAPRVKQDRTYISAVSLKRWLEVQGISPKRVNVITQGPHARRSWLMFKEALGDTVEVGIISAPPADYEPSEWWRSSAGVRGTIGELLGYLYVKVFFRAT